MKTSNTTCLQKPQEKLGCIKSSGTAELLSPYPAKGLHWRITANFKPTVGEHGATSSLCWWLKQNIGQIQQILEHKGGSHAWGAGRGRLHAMREAHKSCVGSGIIEGWINTVGENTQHKGGP